MNETSSATDQTTEELLTLADRGYPIRPALGLDLLDGETLWVVCGYALLIIHDDGLWELRIYPEYKDISGRDWTRYVDTCHQLAEMRRGSVVPTDRGVMFSGGVLDLAVWFSLYLYPAENNYNRGMSEAYEIMDLLGASWMTENFSLCPVPLDLSEWKISLISPYGGVLVDGREEFWPPHYGVDVIEFLDMASQISDEHREHIIASPGLGIRGDVVFAAPRVRGEYRALREVISSALRFSHKKLWTVRYNDPNEDEVTRVSRPVLLQRKWSPDYSLPSMIKKGVLR